MRFLLLTLVGTGMGCSVLPESVPEGSSLQRCSKYTGNAVGPFTGSSIHVDGCQCIQDGEVKGSITFKLPDCEITFNE